MRKIGLLAIHGSVAEHAQALQKIGCEPVEVRLPTDFENLNGLIIPGGESTTIADLSSEYGLKEALIKFATTPFESQIVNRRSKLKAVFGTCAGLIILSKLGLLDVTVDRNAYGRQIHSFEADLKIPNLGKPDFPGIFIRAPKIIQTGKNVETLATYEQTPIFVRQNNIWGASFHPELTGDLRIHKLIFGDS